MIREAIWIIVVVEGGRRGGEGGANNLASCPKRSVSLYHSIIGRNII